MKITKATYEINQNEVTITRLDSGDTLPYVTVSIYGRHLVCVPGGLGDDESETEKSLEPALHIARRCYGVGTTNYTRDGKNYGASPACSNSQLREIMDELVRFFL